jgi:acetoacetyl-CoA synthetase
LSQLLAGLANRVEDATPKVVIIHAIPQSEDRRTWEPGWVGWDAFIDDGRNSRLGITPEGEIEWVRLPFDAPLWILFSSGTTGKPKYVSRLKNS